MVLSATSWDASSCSSTPAGEAMAALCQAYWHPLYSYIRRCGHSAADAEDLTQEFFATLMSKQSLADVDRRKGKFRHFLLAAVKHFLSNQRDRASAVKRGGGQAILSLDRNEAEGRYGREPADLRTPEMSFERQWALAVLQRVLDGLKMEYVAAGKGGLFDELKETLAGTDKPESYQAIASRLSTTEGTIKVLAYRFRRRYRQLLCEEIGQTVAEPGQIDE
jgi:RNA polymerase sigma factor (sigma-70 family)